MSGQLFILMVGKGEVSIVYWMPMCSVFILFVYNIGIIKKIKKHTGQKHLTVNHSKEYKTADGVHTNVVEGTDYALKCT